MGNAIQEVRAYVADMLRATRGMLGPVQAQLESPELESMPEARWLLERLLRMLSAHAEELAEHLQRLGAGSAAEKEASTLATDLMDTAMHRIAPERVAKALRDYYTALSLAHAGGLMLETNARALGFSSTAALATRHREELLSMLERIRELLPSAVKGEVQIQERQKSA